MGLNVCVSMLDPQCTFYTGSSVLAPLCLRSQDEPE
jgi:hypothetical protein